MTPAEAHLALADSIRELTQPRTNTEPYTIYTHGKWKPHQHKTNVRSLLEQLHDTLEPGSTTTDHGHAVPGSRPTARLEAIDTLLRIDAEVSQWIGYLDLHERPSLDGNLHALVGIAGEIDLADLTKLARNALRWVTAARVTTGWEVPPWRPANTCPICAERGGLRVRAGDGISSTEVSAACVLCGETWDPGSIGLLAAHIRAENCEDDDVAS